MSNNEMSDNPKQAPTAAAAEVFRFRAAYERTAAARAAIDPGDLASLRVDMGMAIDTVFAALPRITALRSELAKTAIDLELIDALGTYAHAAGHALALYNAATTPPEELAAIHQEASGRRAALKSDAMNLALHGLLNRDAVTSLKGEVGFRNVGYDLLSLVAIYREAWERIEGRTAVLAADLDRAEIIAGQLLELAALREARRVTDPNIADSRHRAFTLMHKAYNQVRRALVFLRWETGDASKIAPPLYGKGGRRRDSDDDQNDQLGIEQDATPATNGTTNGGQPPAVAPTGGNVAPGVQGGSPFA
jgi:hypothetical protein